MSRFAFIADIHGNLGALQSVLEQLDTVDSDAILCLGDIVLGQDFANECIELLQSRNVICIQGNADAVVCGLREPYHYGVPCILRCMKTRAMLSVRNKRFLTQLKREFLLEGKYLCVHSSPRHIDEYVNSRRRAVENFRYLKNRNEVQICFYGHNHEALLYEFASGEISEHRDVSNYTLRPDAKYLINVGSVGKPKDSEGCPTYLIFDSETLSITYVRTSCEADGAKRNTSVPGILACETVRECLTFLHRGHVLFWRKLVGKFKVHN